MMVPAIASKSTETSFLTSLLQVLGVEKPEGALSLPVDLVVNGKLPIRIFRLGSRWFLFGTIAQKLSQCKKEALLSLLDRASGIWGTLEGNFSYEKVEDSFFLWKEISKLEIEALEPLCDRFLAELEFWRTQAVHAGCTVQDIFN